MNSISLRTAFLLSFVALTGCASDLTAEDADADTALVSQQQQALNPNDDGPADPTGTTPTGGYNPPEQLKLELYSLSAEIRMEDGPYEYSFEQQIYGSIAVKNVTGNIAAVRNLGTWGNPSDRAAANWGASDGAAPKRFEGTTDWSYEPAYLLARTKLCQAGSYASCTTPFAYDNNFVSLPAKVGDSIRLDFHFRDFDAVADDEFCKGTATGTVTRNAQGKLAVSLGVVLNSFPAQSIRGDAPGNTMSSHSTYGCKLWVR